MSVYLNEVAVTAFDTAVKESFQGIGMLRGCVTVRNNVTGNEYRFQQIGKGMAHKRTAPSSDSIPMNVDYSKVLVILEDWDADEYTDMFMQKEVNFDEVRELSSLILKALGRRLDQTIIDAVNDARASLVSIGNFIASDGTGLDIPKLTTLVQLMDDLEIDGLLARFQGLSKEAKMILLLGICVPKQASWVICSGVKSVWILSVKAEIKAGILGIISGLLIFSSKVHMTTF